MSDNYEYDDDNYDEYYKNYRLDKGSIESTYNEWIIQKVKWKYRENHKSYSD